MLPPARLPENLPTPTNSIVLFVVLCLLIFGLNGVREVHATAGTEAA
jgi:hypothetical protein